MEFFEIKFDENFIAKLLMVNSVKCGVSKESAYKKHYEK